MQINPFIFRGYDVRGIVDKDLNPVIVEHLGRSFGTMMKRKGITEFVVGRDCRATGKEYSEAIIRGLISTGADVIDIGMQLVGMFYWSQYHLNRRAGVYVSASHNPPEYNGFKFANDFSETLVAEGVQELRSYCENDEFDPGEGGKVSSDNGAVREAYYADLLKLVPLNKKFKVVVDPSCSTAGEIIPELLRRIGCDVVEYNCKIDSSFPLGTPDPTELVVMERLKKEVLAEKADIGLTFDADGDRIGAVDSNGRILWNDVLAAIISQDVLLDHPGATIMYNLLCSKVVEEAIIQAGGKPFQWRVGHSFLKKKNQEVGAAFIGELSGHFFFMADYFNFDDGGYSMMRFLRFLDRSGITLSEAVDRLPNHYISSPEIKVFCDDSVKVDLVDNTLKGRLMKDFPDAMIIDDERAGDGLRLERPGEMMVVRYSQNGPYITIKFEALTQERYEEMRKYLNNFLHEYPQIGWEDLFTVNAEALMHPSI